MPDILFGLENAGDNDYFMAQSTHFGASFASLNVAIEARGQSKAF
jgi:hypothetical protein